MSKLSLHIGMPKTGTTSIQLGLRELKLLGPQFQILQNPAHLCFLMGETNISKNLERRLNIENVDILKRDLLSELRSIDAENLVLSSEFIFEAAVNGELRKLREGLRNFDEVEVIAYIRHPLKHFSSLISQRVKSGQFKDEAIFRVPVKYYNYNDIFEKISEHFKLKVFDFERHKSNLVTHFFDTVGLEVPNLAPSERKNVALSQEALDFSIRINELTSRSDDKKRRALIDDLNRALLDSTKISIKDVEKVNFLMRIAEEQNRKLVGKYITQKMKGG